jgi:hypothetical protein
VIAEQTVERAARAQRSEAGTAKIIAAAEVRLWQQRSSGGGNDIDDE